MKKFGFMFSLFLLVTTSGFGQQETPKKHLNISNGLAIEGYDPVAYFKQNKAVKGNKNYAVTNDGVNYYFSSLENKEEFLKKPAKYKPEFGGWCAYAMGLNGEKVEVDPSTFKIINNKLYLFYHTWTNNTLTKWNKEEDNLKAKAEKNWQITLQK